MRKLLLILAIISCASLAHAAACGSSAAGCVQQKSAGAATGANLSIAYDSNNTAGNSDFVYAWVKCGSTSLSVPTVTFSDSNGNFWNSSLDSTYSTNDPKIGIFFGWAATIVSGANTVTLTNAAADCQILVAIEFEYSGLVVWNSTTSQRVNDQFMPLPPINTSTTFPINANQSWGVPSQTDTAFVCGIHDGANTGTWSITAGWNQVASSSVTNAAQMSCWDSIANVAPSAISISNTSGTVTHAIGEWMIFNRQTAPVNQAPIQCSNNVRSGDTVTCSIAAVLGRSIALWGNISGGSGVVFTSTCGTPTAQKGYTAAGYLVGMAVLLPTSTGPCAVTATSAGGGESSIGAVMPATSLGSSGTVAFSYLRFGSDYIEGTIVPYPPITDSANMTHVIFVASQQGSGWALNCPSGYSSAVNVGNGGISNNIGGCYKAGISAGTTLNTSMTTGTAHQIYGEFLFRSVEPTFGEVQGIVCENNAACQAAFPPVAGDTYLLSLNCSDVGLPVVTSSPPVTIKFEPGINEHNCRFRVDNISTTPITFSCTGAACSTNIFLTEYRGLAATHPLYDTAINFNYKGSFGGGLSTTSWPSTPAHVLRAGNYLLYSALSNVAQYTDTCDTSTPFIPRLLDAQGNGMNLLCDQVVTSSSSATYLSTPTWATPTPSATTTLAIYGSKTNTDPHVVQTAFTGYTGTSVTLNWNNDVAAGDDALIITSGACTSPTTATWGATSTNGTPVLARGGGATDSFAVWDVHNMTGGPGSATVTTNCSAGHALIQLVEIFGIQAIQAGNSMVSGGPSITTGSVTSSAPATLFASGLGACCNLTDSYVTELDPSWTQVQTGYQDNVNLMFYTKVDLAPATESNSGVCGTCIETRGYIVPLTLNPITPTIVQPFVNLITKNDPSRYMGEWRK